MGKREASMFAAQLEGVDVDAPRAKRQKTTAGNTVTAKEEPAATNGLNGGDVQAADGNDDPEVVREKGLKLWQAIKDAVNKEGRILSVDFLRLPSKRQYPDYYELIKRPIALDDIKRQLDGGAYATFEEVKQDFEQCFKNAKRYNMKESQIWKDAKHLHKLVTKESNKLTGANEPVDGDDHDGNADGSDAEGDGGKKKKPPNMTRLLKSRLQKLVEKTDDEGRILSAEFMELPNKKLWPMYYKQIKRPQCFENIFKHLKRKEYVTALDFANDVELVFSNALEFNQEHTPIWEDTIILRDYFRQLMSDLPPPYSISAYASSDHSTKIKLKMPAAMHHAAAVSPSVHTKPLTPQPVTATLTASPRLRIPPLASTSTGSTPGVPTQSHTPAMPPPAAPVLTSAAGTTFTIVFAPPVQPTAVPQATASSTVQPSTFNQHGYAYVQQKQPYAAQSYQQPPASTSTPSLPNTNNIHVNPGRVAARTHHVTHAPRALSIPQTPQQPPPVQVPNQIPQSLMAAKSPTPVTMQNRRQLRHVSVITKPFGRRLDLDYRDGVRTWSARLGPGETSIYVGDVKFLSIHHGEDDDSSDEEEHRDKEKAEVPAPETERHEEEEEAEEVQEPPPKRGRGRPRKRPRGGKPVEASPKSKGKAKAAPTEDEVQMKLNGTLVGPLEEEKEAWEVTLAPGLNVIEVGEMGGIVWRMYLDRIIAA